MKASVAVGVGSPRTENGSPFPTIVEGGPPRRQPLARRRRRRRKHYYAILATRDEIILPEHSPLGYLTQARLIQRAQANDTEALQEVWARNARLAFSAANRVRVRPQFVADLVQEAQAAFPRAIRGFDVDRLLEFSTYAFTAIRRELGRRVGQIVFSIPLPGYLWAPYHEFRQQIAGAPSADAWFDARDEFLTRDANAYRRLLRVHLLAMPAPLAAAADEPAGYADPTAHVFAADLRQQVLRALAALPERHRVVLAWRYGLVGGRPWTLEEVGAFLGLTKERVRQVQVQAEAALRGSLSAAGWDLLPEDPLAVRAR